MTNEITERVLTLPTAYEKSIIPDEKRPVIEVVLEPTDGISKKDGADISSETVLPDKTEKTELSKPRSFFPYLCLFFVIGCALPLFLFRYELLPEKLLSELITSASAHLESCNVSLTFADISALTLKLSRTDIFLFALVILSSVLRFYRSFLSVSVLSKAFLSASAIGLFILSKADTADIIAAALFYAMSAVLFFTASKFACEYGAELDKKTAGYRDLCKFAVYSLSALGGTVALRIITIIFVSINFH